jgi:hypothetical protein
MNTQPDSCNCSFPVSRRQFLKSTVAGAAVVAAGGLPLLAAEVKDKAAKAPASETLVTSFYKTLTDAQKKEMAFPFDHTLRSKVDNNWHITKPKLSDFYTQDQQAMVREIFMKLHSPEYADKVYKQVEHDSGKEGFGSSSVALFGTPGTGKFEFVLTGRHCTRRCDGDSVAGAAFGGPIFYGHAAESFNEKADHAGNTYWYQAMRANEVFKALDGKQRELALLEEGRAEKGTDTVKLTGKKTGLPGIPVSSLSKDQRELVNKVMADLLAPFREEDRKESMKLVEANGVDNLHMAFYRKDDIGNDNVWDVWQIEGPAMVWYFRGAPHVHTWVHIRDKA